MELNLDYFSKNALCFANKRLLYVGQDCIKIPDFLISYAAQTNYLDLSSNQLVSLKGLEHFYALEELILDNNNLNDTTLFPHIPSLKILSINKNKIFDLDLLLSKLTTSYKNLHLLSILGNPACPDQLSDIDKDEEDYRRYRLYTIFHIPSLNFLDFKEITNEERNEALTKGKFMKVIKPNSQDLLTGNNSSPSIRYTPLPSSFKDISLHQGAYGKCRFKYSGKNSEGNRFIVNNDL